MKFLFRNIVFLALAMLHVPSLADDKFVLVENEAQLSDSATYLITYEKKGSYRNLTTEQVMSGSSITRFHGETSYKSLEELSQHTTLFSIVNEKGKHYLYEKTSKKYVGQVMTQHTHDQTFWNDFVCQDQPDESAPLTLQQVNGLTNIFLGSYTLRFMKNNNIYRLVSKNNTVYLPVKLYRIDNDNSEIADTLTLSTETDLGDVDFKGDVKFCRTFEDNYYNTLCLPFSVQSARAVFGSGITLFGLVASTDSTITFRPLADDSIQANTPYLISGTFQTGPYVFHDISFSHKASQTESVTRSNGITIHGVYARQHVGGTQALILFKKAFYSCTHLPNMTVEPYKWYLSAPSSKALRRLLIVTPVQ